MNSILVVEDDDSLREVLDTFLQSKGFKVIASTNSNNALTIFKNSSQISCVLADFKLPDKNGIELLKEIRNIDIDTPFIMMTAYGSISIAVEAMKLGANDFITKPFEPESLANIIEQVVKFKRIIHREPYNQANKRFITNDEHTLKVIAQAKKFAKVDSSVLITGETGTGKELVARLIHANSVRNNNPFVAVNCAALPIDLLESELFGHEVGAYTGATQRRIGIFEYASKGTIFLDEICDMPPIIQVKLLRTLQEHEIKRVGGITSIPVNPRIIAATNYDTEEALNSGKLREDFYYRLAVISLSLPPLREKANDIPILANYFISYYASVSGKTPPVLTKAALDLLKKYSWPGNVRELENIIERAVLLCEGEIKPEHLGIRLDLDLHSLSQSTLALQEIVAKVTEQTEREIITKVLKYVNWNKSRAAKILKVSYKTLLNKIKQYEMLTPM